MFFEVKKKSLNDYVKKSILERNIAEILPFFLKIKKLFHGLILKISIKTAVRVENNDNDWPEHGQSIMLVISI